MPAPCSARGSRRVPPLQGCFPEPKGEQDPRTGVLTVPKGPLPAAPSRWQRISSSSLPRWPFPGPWKRCCYSYSCCKKITAKPFPN